MGVEVTMSIGWHGFAYVIVKIDQHRQCRLYVTLWRLRQEDKTSRPF